MECSPGHLTRCNAVIEAGQKSPIDGVVMTPDLAIFLGQSTEAAQEKLDAAVTATAAVCREDRKKDAKFAAADKHVVEVERDAYKRAADRSLWEHPVVVSAITIAAMIGLFLAANAVTKVGRDIQEGGVQ